MDNYYDTLIVKEVIEEQFGTVARDVVSALMAHNDHDLTAIVTESKLPFLDVRNVLVILLKNRLVIAHIKKRKVIYELNMKECVN